MGGPDLPVRAPTHDDAPQDHTQSRAGDLFSEHHEYAARLARHCARGTAVDPDDAAQIGRLTCWLSAGRWVDFGSPFRAYLSQRIRWAILDEVRSQRWTTGPRDASAVYARPEPISPTTHPCGVDGGYETAEVLADVGRAIEDLPETTRHAAALLASGLSPTQVAERLGVTQSRVSQHRRRLRAALERIARSIP